MTTAIIEAMTRNEVMMTVETIAEMIAVAIMMIITGEIYASGVSRAGTANHNLAGM